MRPLSPLLALLLALGPAPSAAAQFSASGGGSLVPASGSGDDVAAPGDGLAVFPTTLPGLEATSSVTVSVPVTSVDRVEIDDLSHSWAGDTMATLEDPAGVEHLLWLRPGATSNTSFGSSGDFTGSLSLVESGGASLPTSGDIAPGNYNQAFDTGSGVTWNSGDGGILNTPLGAISGPAGTWTLHIYDWASGDVGSFTSWTLSGNGAGGGNTGFAYCSGDGTGGVCPCAAFGGPGEGCLTTSGTGARLLGTGNAAVGADTLLLSVTGGPPNRPGIFFQGNNQLSGGNGNFAGDGLLCTAGGTVRYEVNPLDPAGATGQTGFGAQAGVGQTRNYQYWFRDTANPCGGLFNFTNGWSVTWQ